jgi:hypothetical protein
VYFSQSLALCADLPVKVDVDTISWSETHPGFSFLLHNWMQCSVSCVILNQLSACETMMQVSSDHTLFTKREACMAERSGSRSVSPNTQHSPTHQACVGLQEVGGDYVLKLHLDENEIFLWNCPLRTNNNSHFWVGFEEPQ